MKEFNQIKQKNSATSEMEKASSNWYTHMRVRYLMENMPSYYRELIRTDTLHEDLISVDRRATKMTELLTKQYKEKWGVTEQLKAHDQMKWVRLMNNIQSCVETAENFV